MAFRLNQQTYPFNPNASAINTRNTAFSGQAPNPGAPTASPAMAAMGQSAAAPPMATQLGQRPQSPAVAATGNTPQAGTTPPATPPRTDLVTPNQVDTSRQDKIYSDQLAQSDKDRETMMQTGYNTISALQRRNASNSALGGFSVGGGAYLSGQRQAAVAGINSFNQGLLNWGTQRQNIMGQAAGTAANSASQNANISNQANQFNAGREGNVQDRTANAEATRTAQQTENDVTNFGTDLKQYGIDIANPHGATNAIALSLSRKLQAAAPGSPEYAAAAAQMSDYKAKLAHAKQLYLSGGGEKGNFSFGGKVYSNISLDDYLKLQEKEGLFNGL